MHNISLIKSVLLKNMLCSKNMISPHILVASRFLRTCSQQPTPVARGTTRGHLPQKDGQRPASLKTQAHGNQDSTNMPTRRRSLWSSENLPIECQSGEVKKEKKKNQTPPKKFPSFPPEYEVIFWEHSRWTTLLRLESYGVRFVTPKVLRLHGFEGIKRCRCSTLEPIENPTLWRWLYLKKNGWWFFRLAMLVLWKAYYYDYDTPWKEAILKGNWSIKTFNNRSLGTIRHYVN